MMRASILVTAALLAACSGDDDNVATIDAAPSGGADAKVDAMPSTVQVVACGSEAKTAVTVVGGNKFMVDPDHDIKVNESVSFSISGGHSAVSGTAFNADGKFLVMPGLTPTCLKFTVAGDFPFYCDPHGFTEVIKVAP